MTMKNILSALFLTFSLFNYSNPVPISLHYSSSILAAPETSSATITVLEGSTTQINLSDYTTGSPTSYSIVSETVHKSSNSNGLGGSTYYYTHGGSEAPSDSFTFQATNSDGDSNISTITINITNVNDAPTIDAIDKTVEEGSSVEITVIGKDAENAELTITNGNATNGTVTKDAITERRTTLATDIGVVRQKLQSLEQQRIESVGLINALTGALQQCDDFLKKIDNDGPDDSDSSDVE